MRHHPKLFRRNIDKVDLRVPAILLQVRPAHHNRNRLPIGRYLLIADPHDLREVIGRKPAALRKTARSEGEQGNENSSLPQDEAPERKIG
jgi:hypothetical protein